jgi:hypothetical protein
MSPSEGAVVDGVRRKDRRDCARDDLAERTGVEGRLKATVPPKRGAPEEHVIRHVRGQRAQSLGLQPHLCRVQNAVRLLVGETRGLELDQPAEC